MYINPATIGQGVRIAGTALKNLGLTAAANPRISATLGAGALGAIHGNVAGQHDPYSSGLGGALGYGALGGALGGVPGAVLGASLYGIGQDAGTDSGALAKLKALDQAVLGGAGANPVASTRGITEKELEDYLRKRDMTQQTIQNALRSIRPHTTVGGNI